MTRDDLKALFSQDAKLISDWHILAGEGLDACTDDTWNRIKDLEHHTFDWGYFAIDRASDLSPWLVGFFIIPDYRGKVDFWKEVNSVVNSKVYFAGLYNKNIPGNKFLKKQGRAIRTDEITTVYVIRRG